MKGQFSGKWDYLASIYFCLSGSQKFENDSSNDGNDPDGKTASNENEIQETEVTNKHETVPFENVETNENTSNENKIEGQHESEINKDGNDASPDLNHNGQSGREISSESNEDASYPSSKEQIIRQHKFYIHSTWLAVQSSYFRSLFFSGMKESSTKEVHVQISTNEEQAHLMLLEAMYKIDILDKASVDQLLEVLRLAHKYDVKFVFKKCKYCLQAVVVSLKICEQIMRFIKIDNIITDVEDLVRSLQSFLAKKFRPLDKTWQTTSFKELCKPSLKYLLSSNQLVTASENTVFHALMYWIEEHGIENVLESQELPSLLSVVRFELIPIDYLYNMVQHNALAKKLPDFNHLYLKGISYHALSDKIRDFLPRKPVMRKGCTFVSYTWVIPRHTLDALVGTDKGIKSDEFWYCGYQVVVSITHVNKPYQETFSAKLSLEILNLKQHSNVEIFWQPESKDFTSGYYGVNHTFQKDTHKSTMDVVYRFEVKQKKPQTTVLGAFSFNTTSTSSTFDGFTFGQAQGPGKALSCLSINIKMNLA